MLKTIGICMAVEHDDRNPYELTWCLMRNILSSHGMAVSHLFPYPDSLLALQRQLLQTLYVHRESTDDDPDTYVFIRKHARRARCQCYPRKTHENASYKKLCNINEFYR